MQMCDAAELQTRVTVLRVSHTRLASHTRPLRGLAAASAFARARRRRSRAAMPAPGHRNETGPRPDPLRDVDEEERRRVEAQAAIGRTVDAILRKTDAAGEARPTGCLAVVRAIFGARRGSAAGARVAGPVGAATAAPAAPSRRAGHSVFGLGAGRRMDATTKLEEAAATMRARVEQLEERVAEQRGEATRLARDGQRPAALRALKKANGLQRQVDSNQAAVDAVEQQLDALSQAAVHKTLASALASTSRTMKQDSKALGKAEAAIDDAQEARDMANDLSQVMTEFAATGTGVEDEDELARQLEEMVTSAAAPDPPTAAAAAEQLATQHAEWDAAEAVRARMLAPPAHTSDRARWATERAGLLAQA